MNISNYELVLEVENLSIIPIIAMLNAYIYLVCVAVYYVLSFHVLNYDSIYTCLPFHGPSSYKVWSEIQAMLEFAILHVVFRIILRKLITVVYFFQIKERILCDLRSCLQYNYQCSRCTSRYICSTTRCFRARRLKSLSRLEYSQIRSHSEETSHSVSHNNFSIVYSARDATSLIIL